MYCEKVHAAIFQSSSPISTVLGKIGEQIYFTRNRVGDNDVHFVAVYEGLSKAFMRYLKVRFE